MTTEIKVFLDVAPFIYADKYSFGKTGCLHVQCRLLKTEVAAFSEALVSLRNYTTQHARG